MVSWSEVHERQLEGYTPSEFGRMKTAYKRKLLARVSRYWEGGKVLEAGCGTSTSLARLQDQGIPVIGLDCDFRTTLFAHDLTGVEVVAGDTYALPFLDQAFDVVFSNGVLEHFDDAGIRLCVEEQLRVARTVIVSVPSRQYLDSQRMFGDERFMTLREWSNLLSPTASILEVFGFHHRPSLAQRVFAWFDTDWYQFLGFVLQR